MLISSEKAKKVYVLSLYVMSFCLGMLRWTLHNRVDRNPSISVPLVRVLIKELEKVCFFKVKCVKDLCGTRFYHQSWVAVVRFSLDLIISLLFIWFIPGGENRFQDSHHTFTSHTCLHSPTGQISVNDFVCCVIVSSQWCAIHLQAGSWQICYCRNSSLLLNWKSTWLDCFLAMCDACCSSGSLLYFSLYLFQKTSIEGCTFAWEV